MNASIGNAQFSLSSGQTYTQPSPGTYIGGTEALGQQDPTEIANQTYGFGETNTFDPASIAAAALGSHQRGKHDFGGRDDGGDHRNHGDGRHDSRTSAGHRRQSA